MLKVLCVANSDTKIQIFKLHTHCKKLRVSNCVIHFGYINAGKSQILGIFFANCGFFTIFWWDCSEKLGIFAKTNPKVRKL